MQPTDRAVPRLHSLRVRNYRVLEDLELRDLTPLTVFVGRPGSGKSTIFDVLAFLAECFTGGLRMAWDRRGRFRELRTRGAEGPIEIELSYREQPDQPSLTYHLEVDERDSGPFLKAEWLEWRPEGSGSPLRYLDFRQGKGYVTEGSAADSELSRTQEALDSDESLAVNALGQLARHPRVAGLRRFISGWYLSYLTAESARGQPEAGPQERLSQSGDNLPNVIQYLKERHPQRLEEILRILRERVPRLETVDADVLPDGRLLLRLKDAPFDRPISARFASDGTLKMLSYLTILQDPAPPPLIGIEEPENYLYPQLLEGLSEECRRAAGLGQLLVTTHSPFFVNGLRPQEVRILFRDEAGFAQALRPSEIPGIREFVEEGAKLGELWMEDHFSVEGLPAGLVR